MTASRQRGVCATQRYKGCVDWQLINIELIWSTSLKCQQQTLCVCPATAAASSLSPVPVFRRANPPKASPSNPIALFVSLFQFLFHVALYSMCVIILRPCELRTWTRTHTHTHMGVVFKPVVQGGVRVREVLMSETAK